MMSHVVKVDCYSFGLEEFNAFHSNLSKFSGTLYHIYVHLNNFVDTTSLSRFVNLGSNYLV